MMTKIHIPKHVQRQCSLDELTFIGNRLNELSAKELLVFKGALKLNPANTPKEFINRSYQLEDYRVCLGASDTETLGQFSRDHFGNFLKEEDNLELGEELLKQLPDGAFIDGSYVYRCSDEQFSPYDGINLNCLPDNFYSVKLRLASPDNLRFCSLRLPDMSPEFGMPDEIVAARMALEVDSIEQCRLVDGRCILPEVGSLLKEYEGRLLDLIRDGNTLGWRMQHDDSVQHRLTVAMDYDDYGTLYDALRLYDHLSDYDFLWRGFGCPSHEMEMG